ncbi:hypothetical protein [Streptomyces violascens]|uniref:Uncharacterized protein n=1 Tax=Streptomyces violascens TaxID=67381 RepID=A0ABQ3QWE2_9ACTN|nr:hypothetical protein [Streptomyces violascens]GHI41583.1 hypothetical protein Sviol_59910 [Streptomyces violascens]
MRSWNSLTLAEQTLLRRAMSQDPLAGMIQTYGMALRWAHAEEAPPPRSYSAAEQRELVPMLGAVMRSLVERDLVIVREVAGMSPSPSDPVLTGDALHAVLKGPANWLWTPTSERRFSLATPDAVRRDWGDDACPVMDADGFPAWDGLSRAQREVLVCAAEASGMLTGPFGIWEDLPSGLLGAERIAWVDRQFTPLIPFVRAGWIEVRHYPGVNDDAFTVIPADDLQHALADPAIRYEGDEWGVGIGCVFTDVGLAVWRGGWGRAWGRRLRID